MLKVTSMIFRVIHLPYLLEIYLWKASSVAIPGYCVVKMIGMKTRVIYFLYLSYIFKNFGNFLFLNFFRRLFYTNIFKYFPYSTIKIVSNNFYIQQKFVLNHWQSKRETCHPFHCKKMLLLLPVLTLVKELLLDFQIIRCYWNEEQQ